MEYILQLIQELNLPVKNEKAIEYLNYSVDLFAKMNKPIPLQIFLTDMLDLKNSKIELLKEQKDLLNDQKSGQWIT